MRHRKAASKVQTPVTDARVNHVLDAHGRGRGPNTRNKRHQLTAQQSNIAHHNARTIATVVSAAVPPMSQQLRQ